MASKANAQLKRLLEVLDDAGYAVSSIDLRKKPPDVVYAHFSVIWPPSPRIAKAKEKEK